MDLAELLSILSFAFIIHNYLIQVSHTYVSNVTIITFTYDTKNYVDSFMTVFKHPASTNHQKWNSYGAKYVDVLFLVSHREMFHCQT